jgi:hypothetical protein
MGLDYTPRKKICPEKKTVINNSVTNSKTAPLFMSGAVNFFIV